MEHCNQCNNLSYKKRKKKGNPVFITKSKGLLGEYIKTKRTRDPIESILITPQIDNLLLIKELPAQRQQQKH